MSLHKPDDAAAHDGRCESEFIIEAGAWTSCRCAQRSAVVEVLAKSDNWHLVWNAFDDERPTPENYAYLATQIVEALERVR